MIRLDPANTCEELDELQQATNDLEVAAGDPLDVGVLGFDGKVSTVAQRGGVNLGERGGSDRLAIERCEELVRAAPEFGLQAMDDLVVGARRQTVLEPLQLVSKLRRKKFERMLMSCPTLMNRPPAARIAEWMRRALRRWRSTSIAEYRSGAMVERHARSQR